MAIEVSWRLDVDLHNFLNAQNFVIQAVQTPYFACMMGIYINNKQFKQKNIHLIRFEVRAHQLLKCKFHSKKWVT